MPELENQEMRDRVENLRKTDRPDEKDSVLILAKKEATFRQHLEKKGVKDPKDRDSLADEYSDETLRAMENEKEKMIDDLTKLYKRKFFNEMALKYLNLTKRDKTDGSILVLDADCFKKINNDYGHPAGDEVLKALAATIKRVCRESDVVSRYGEGDEFIIFLYDTNTESAKEVAERIRKAVEEMVIEVDDDAEQKITLPAITVSIGCANTKDLVKLENLKEDMALAQLVRMADKALYASKNNGRDKVTVFSEIGKGQDKK